MIFKFRYINRATITNIILFFIAHSPKNVLTYYWFVKSKELWNSLSIFKH